MSSPSDFYQHNIFNVPLWGYILNDEYYHCIDYVEYLNQLKVESKLVKNNTSFSTKKDLFEHPLFFELNNKVLGYAHDIIKSYNNDSVPQLKINQMWGNIDYKYSCNIDASEDSILSGVFFIDIPSNVGNLSFKNPLLKNSLYFAHKEYIIPFIQLGCILYPSWLEVSKNTIDSDHSTISINFSIGEK